MIGVTGLDLEHFGSRVVQEAFMTGRQSFWRRRAREFEAAMSRPGDYRGEATAADVAAMDARLAAVARACRARAELAPLLDEDNDADLVLDEAVDDRAGVA